MRPSGSNDTLVTSGFSANFYGTGSIINAPSSGVTHELTTFSLPVGEYVVKVYAYFSTSEHYLRICNKTDDTQDTVFHSTYPVSSTIELESLLTVEGSTKEYQLQTAHVSTQDSAAAMGVITLGASNLIPHIDIKFYKLS